MNKYLKTIIKYSITFAAGVGLFFLVVGLRNIYNQTDIKQIYRFLADGFTIPGVLMLCFGCLLLLSNWGALTGIGYALKHAITMLIPIIPKKHETYAEYCERRKPLKGFGFLFIVGFIFLATGIVFTILFSI